MTIQQIKYVIAVKELRHFGLAAEKCFVTQSTLSTMIGKLEDEIGIQIFDRKTKPVNVTKEGEALIDRLSIILKEIENFKEQVKLLKGELSGDFKIGIIPTIAPYILPRFLGEFTRKYPKIHFSISELTTAEIVAKLKKRDLDIGIAAIPLKEADLIEYPLYKEEFVLYDCFTSGQKGIAQLDDIDFEKFWLLEEGHCFGNQVVKVCNLQNKVANSKANFEFKAGSIDSLIRFVKGNNGNTLLPYLATIDFKEQDKENVSFFCGKTPVRTIGIITHQHFVKKQILKLLSNNIIDKITPLLSANQRENANKVISPF